MVSLRLTLQKAHDSLTQAGVDHALIGGIALATLGITRSTDDVDLLIDGQDREKAKTALGTAGFRLRAQTLEVLHFEGAGKVDILLANRPLSREMLSGASRFPQHGIKCVSAEDIIGLKIQAYVNDPKRELQDKADIQALIQNKSDLDWGKIKKFADLFGQWEEIVRIKARAGK